MNLDLTDKKMLLELDKNGRIPVSHLAKKLRINQNTAQYRLKKLEDTGYIKGYYTIIDNSKLGYFGFRIYLRLANSDQEIDTEIHNYLIALTEVHVLSRLEGNYDLAIMCWVKTIYEFYEFWNNFKEKFKKNMGRVQIAIFTKVIHFDRNYLVQNQKNSEPPKSLIVGGSPEVQFDERDIKILKIMSNNARVSVLEISKKLNMPAKTIAYRIKQLEKNDIIVGYKPLLNLEKIGYKYYKINIVLSETIKIRELIEFAKYNPFITYIDFTISQNDFEIDIEVSTREEINRIMNEIKNITKITDYEEITFREYIKLVYF